MSEMRVSVVIPAYKAAVTIGRAVDSVLAQTHPAHEVLIVDDGSPDDIAAAIASYGERVTLIRKSNGGAASARNLGIERATGDLVAFLDADDYWEPQKLERHVAVFARHPMVGLTCGRHFSQPPGGERQVASQGSQITYDTMIRPKGREAFELALRVWTGTVVVRRSVLGDERFVSGLEPAEDRHLWVRLVMAAPVYYFSEPMATAVLEDGSLSRSNVDRDCRNMLKVVRTFRETMGWSACRRWESHTLYRWAACDDNPRTALSRLVQSWALWPLPYRRGDVRNSLARLRLLAVTLRRLVWGESSISASPAKTVGLR